jgi:hypothetical protein
MNASVAGAFSVVTNQWSTLIFFIFCVFVSLNLVDNSVCVFFKT